MKQPVRKSLIHDREAIEVPFNYMLAKFPISITGGQKVDVVKGRHVERTYGNNTIQNSLASKAFFYKPITRYDVQL